MDDNEDRETYSGVEALRMAFPYLEWRGDKREFQAIIAWCRIYESRDKVAAIEGAINAPDREPTDEEREFILARLDYAVALLARSAKDIQQLTVLCDMLDDFAYSPDGVPMLLSALLPSLKQEFNGQRGALLKHMASVTTVRVIQDVAREIYKPGMCKKELYSRVKRATTYKDRTIREHIKPILAELDRNWK